MLFYVLGKDLAIRMLFCVFGGKTLQLECYFLFWGGELAILLWKEELANELSDEDVQGGTGDHASSRGDEDISGAGYRSQGSRASPSRGGVDRPA